MYRTQTQATWQRNLVWLGALLLGIVAVLATIYWPLSRLSSEQYGPQVLRAGVAAALPNMATAGLDTSTYTPGSPLALLPGFNVYIDASEIPTFTPEQVISRGAGVLTETVFAGGIPAVEELATHAAFAPQLTALFQGALPVVLASEFETTLFAAGIADTSRVTDWRAQQGQRVQPLVGVFVQLDRTQLDGLSAREIGVLVIRELTGILIAEGQAAAVTLLNNEAHQAAFTQAVPAVKQRAHDLFTVLLYGFQESVRERLEQARDALTGAETPLAGSFVNEQELATLTPSERQEFVAKRLADLVYEVGVTQAARTLSDTSDRQQLLAANPLLKWFDRTAHEGYLRWQFVLWGTMVLLTIVVAWNTRGVWRLALPALVIAVSAVPIALVRSTVLDLPGNEQWHQYVMLVLEETVTYALYIGAGLILLQLLALTVRGLRPRRRRRLL